MDKKTFGIFLKNLRIDKGFTLQKFSEETGITTAQLRNIEKGRNKPSVMSLTKIAKSLNYDFDKLYDEFIK